jgi:hypothetical protein
MIAVDEPLPPIEDDCPVPESQEQAIAWLVPMLKRTVADLMTEDDEALKKAWAAIAYIYPGLHPDELELLLADATDAPVATFIEIDLSTPEPFGPDHEDSGWPFAFAALAAVVKERYGDDRWSDAEYYAVTAQRTGMSRS